MGVAASQSHDVGLLAWLRRWGKPAHRTPGGWKDLQAPGANPLTSDVVAYVALYSRSGGALASEERQTPHAEPLACSKGSCSWEGTKAPTKQDTLI